MNASENCPFKRACSAIVCVLRLLLLSGDVEVNPGPMTKAQEEKLDTVAETVLRLEASNATLIEAVTKVLNIHATLKTDLENLTKRVQELETKLELASSVSTSANHESGLSNIVNKIDDLENRSRRSNVLFYGIADSDSSESWETSEQLVNDFCLDKLGVTVTSVARAHRVGRFSTEKARPIIAKFINDKEIEAILSNGRKLKETNFSIGRDYSLAHEGQNKKSKFIAEH
ncbi:uncharacterized protein LOC144108342 [Amblyomma americanum]